MFGRNWDCPKKMRRRIDSYQEKRTWRDVRFTAALGDKRTFGYGQRKSRRRVEKIGDGFSHGHDTQPAINVAVCCKQKVAVSSGILTRGSLNSAHIHGTDVPVEEPSTASNSEMLAASRCCARIYRVSDKLRADE
jgi:hypothetical protein